LEELISELRFAKKEEVLDVRNKLMKLEMNLMFSLENEEIEPHLGEILNDFLEDLTKIINMTNKIY
jgi:hypothetical protein